MSYRYYKHKLNMLNPGGKMLKVAYVGLSKSSIRLMKKLYKSEENISFIIEFFKDYEKAKEWCI